MKTFSQGLLRLLTLCPPQLCLLWLQQMHTWLCMLQVFSSELSVTGHRMFKRKMFEHFSYLLPARMAWDLNELGKYSITELYHLLLVNRQSWCLPHFVLLLFLKSEVDSCFCFERFLQLSLALKFWFSWLYWVLGGVFLPCWECCDYCFFLFFLFFLFFFLFFLLLLSFLLLHHHHHHCHHHPLGDIMLPCCPRTVQPKLSSHSWFSCFFLPPNELKVCANRSIFFFST